MDTVKLCCNDGDIEALIMWLKYNQKFDLNKPYSFKSKQRDDEQQAKQLHTTYLITAARNGYSDIVKLLIDFKAEVDASCDGVTALSVAISRGHLKTVSTLISAGAKINWERDLKSAARKGDVQMIGLLHSYIASGPVLIAACKETLLDLCRSKRYVDDALVSVLIDPLMGQPEMLQVFKAAIVNHRFHIANVIMAVPFPLHGAASSSSAASCTVRVGALSPAQLSQLMADMICDGSATDKQVSYLINKGADVEFVCSPSNASSSSSSSTGNGLQTIKQYVMASDRVDLKKMVARAGEPQRVGDSSGSNHRVGGGAKNGGKAPFAASSSSSGASRSSGPATGEKKPFNPKTRYMLKPMAGEKQPAWGQ